MSEYGRASVDGRERWLRVRGGEAVLLDAPPWQAREPDAAAESLDPETLDWLPPVAPSKIVCFARTFAAHAVEMGAEPRQQPLVFLKAPTTLLPPGRALLLPPESERVECEGELALVLGRRVRRFPADGDPSDLIAGWLCADDVTARDLQRADGQWTRGKSFDGFCPLSLTFAATAPAPDALLRTEVNGGTCQEARLDAMSFHLGELLAWASSFMTLEPGDLVLTGTPEGVTRLAPGDEVRVSVEGLPGLVHGVESEPA